MSLTFCRSKLCIVIYCLKIAFFALSVSVVDITDMILIEQYIIFAILHDDCSLNVVFLYY